MGNSDIKLPPPKEYGDVSLESVLSTRRSRRHFNTRAIGLGAVSQILWASYGTNKSRKTSPSAGGLYPLIIYLVVVNVDKLDAGLYRYDPGAHTLFVCHGRDIRKELCDAAFHQEMILDAPASLVYTTTFNRVASRYGDRGINRYIPMDVGHSGQNVYLQVEALGLGTCAIGAFNDERVKDVLELPAEEHPLYIMPVGYTSASE